MSQGDMKAYADRIAKEADERYKQAIESMTPEKAQSIVRAAAEILGAHDYLSAEYQLYLVADWLKSKESGQA